MSQNRVFRKTDKGSLNDFWLAMATYLLAEMEQDAAKERKEKEYERYYGDIKLYLLSYRN